MRSAMTTASRFPAEPRGHRTTSPAQDETRYHRAQGGLAENAEALGNVAAVHAETADRSRRLHPEVIRRTVEAGFARHFVPVRFGGLEGTFEEFVAAVATVGRACASAAWCASIFAATPRTAAFLPIAGQEDLWATGPDTLVAGAITPSGVVRPAEGGWSLSGTWGFTSGIDFAEWTLVASMAPRPRGQGHGLYYFAVPRSDYSTIDTWFNVGMRGTGSNTLVLEDVFVPKHRAFSSEEPLSGHNATSSAPCHNVPLKAVSGLAFVVPALGAAQGALSAWIDTIAKKTDMAGKPAPAGPSARLTLAQSAGDIDVAELLLMRAAGSADSGLVGSSTSARNNRDYALAADRLATAVNRLFRATSAGGQGESGVLPRMWRDVNCAVGHPALQLERNAETYANHTWS